MKLSIVIRKLVFIHSSSTRLTDDCQGEL